MPAWIDLHSHTTASDGSLEPDELVALARRTGLAALAITDHDTFDGYEKALPLARAGGLDLVRGIELNSRLLVKGIDQARFVHVLVYFPSQAPAHPFLQWVTDQQMERRERNQKLIDALRSKGVEITLAEVEARGRSLAGRPHFARVLVEKGYASSYEDAFQKYLGEDAPTYVERDSFTTEEVIAIARNGKGIPVVAHPIRIGLEHASEAEIFARLKAAGLVGLEVYHSEHSAALQKYYADLAADLDLLPTGGSDFHGVPKPDIALGTGRDGNVHVPFSFLEGLRRFLP